MKKQEEKLILAFKRLIHVLTTGKNTPYEFGNTTLFRAEVHILEIIGKKAGITATDIVDEMEVTKGAISQIISKLLKKGLINKTSKIDNLKVQELSLTKKGIEVLKYHEEHEKELLKKLTLELTNCRTADIEKFILVVNSVTDFIRM